jgi:hypothetical protein
MGTRVERADIVMVQQRYLSLQWVRVPSTERSSDCRGKREHEGQWQTLRGEEASNGKALSDLPALKPYWQCGEVKDVAKSF